MPIIRRASMVRRKAWWRSIRWRRPIGLLPLDFSPLNARVEAYRHGEPLDLRGFIFLAALGLLLLDALVVFWLSGGFGALRPRRRAAATLADRRTAWRAHATSSGAGAERAAATAAEADAAAGRVRAEGDAAAAPCLHRHRRCRCRRHQQGRARRPHAVPGAAHRAGSRRADRPRSGARRTRLLSADLLADLADRAEAVAGRARTHRCLHEARRHRCVRHPRRDRRAAGRRDARPRHGGAAVDPGLARHPRTRAGAARPRAHQNLLPAARLPRPLHQRPALGRSDAGRYARSKATARRAPATASPRS